MHSRAWSTLEVKAVDRAQRIIEGIASTPSPDRGGDVMEPAGAQFSLPIPFLWNHKDAIGEVFAADVRPDGIYIKARVSTVDAKAPAALKARIEEAWHSFIAEPPLVRGLSIGWAPLETEKIKGTRFTRVLKWIWGELSAVVVPMNTDATILAVKSLDLAASGHTTPRVTGLPVVSAVKAATKPMTIQEQITQFENTRAAKAAAMNALMTKAADEGVTLDDAQTQEYDALHLEVKSVDAHLVRLHDMEKTNVAAATKIAATTDPKAASELRGGQSVIQVKSMLPKGTSFTRYAMAIAAAKGNVMLAEQYAKRWQDSTPEVGLVLKAAIAAGTTTDATWAGPLAALKPLGDEFIDLLRPATILGKIPNLRKVPFGVSVPTVTAGGTYGWVGQGAPKPVTNMAFGTTTLGIAKAAGIIVLTEELVRLSTPSAEEIVRRDMIAGIAAFLDAQFVTPAVAEVTNVSPASITNGTTPLTTAGTSSANARTDILALIGSVLAVNGDTSNLVLIMSQTNAMALGAALNPLGQAMFPGMGATGGTILGIPVVTSQAAGANVILLDAQGILFADDGAVSVDVSREASVQMDSAPTNPPVDATVMVSLWQNNLVGLRAERWINWKRATLASVKYVVATYA